MPSRYFVRAPYANTVEEFADWASKHGRPVAVHCHGANDGKSIAGSVEVEIDLAQPADDTGDE